MCSQHVQSACAVSPVPSAVPSLSNGGFSRVRVTFQSCVRVHHPWSAQANSTVIVKTPCRSEYAGGKDIGGESFDLTKQDPKALAKQHGHGDSDEEDDGAVGA